MHAFTRSLARSLLSAPLVKVVGYVTYERKRYREQFKLRKLQEQEAIG